MTSILKFIQMNFDTIDNTKPLVDKNTYVYLFDIDHTLYPRNKEMDKIEFKAWNNVYEKLKDEMNEKILVENDEKKEFHKNLNKIFGFDDDMDNEDISFGDDMNCKGNGECTGSCESSSGCSGNDMSAYKCMSSGNDIPVNGCCTGNASSINVSSRKYFPLEESNEKSNKYFKFNSATNKDSSIQTLTSNQTSSSSQTSSNKQTLTSNPTTTTSNNSNNPHSLIDIPDFKSLIMSGTCFGKNFFQFFNTTVSKGEKIRGDLNYSKYIKPNLTLKTKLNSIKYPKLCFTNGTQLRAKSILECMDLIDTFDYIICISDDSKLEVAKPFDLSYEFVENILKVSPSKIIFFDDNKFNIDGALQRGWKSYLVNDDKGDNDLLEKIDISLNEIKNEAER